MHNSSIGDFSRGGEIIANRAALFAVNIKRLFIAWLLVSITGFAFTLHKIAEDFEVANYFKLKISAPFFDTLGFGESEISLKFSVQPPKQRQKRKLKPTEKENTTQAQEPIVKEWPGTAAYYANAPEYKLFVQQTENRISKAAVMGVKYGFAYIVMAVLFFIYTGWRKRQQQFIRGASIVSVGELASRITRNRSNFKVGGIPISKEMLGTGFLFIGGMGSGKTQAICHMLDIARDRRPSRFSDFFLLEEPKRAMQAMVFDPSCEYLEQFYQEGDYILNIFDKRCVNWNIFSDVREDFQYYQIASIVIPAENKGEQIWVNSARTLLADLMRIVHRQNKDKATFQQVQEIISSSDLESLHALLESTSSAAIVAPENPRASESIRLTVTASPVYRFLAYMKLDASQPSFSVYDFVQTKSSKWLFVTTRTDMRDVSTPVAQLAITLAIQAAMSRQIQHGNTDFLFCLDELPGLGKIEKLDTLLTEGRKYGAMVMAGAQELSRVENVYGREMTRTLVSGLQSALVLRTTEADSAKRLSEKLGKEDVSEVNESTSFGVSENRDGMNMSQRRTERHVVLPSEIQALPTLEGFLSLPGHSVARVKVPFKKRPKIADGLVLRTDLQVNPPLPVVTPEPASCDEVAPAPSSQAQSEQPTPAGQQPKDELSELENLLSY
jgi:hypothetical protein